MVTIRVLGTGCPRCNELEKMCFNIAAECNLDADIQKITDLKKIAELGVMQTPALIINNKIYCTGKVPVPHVLKKWFLMNNMN